MALRLTLHNIPVRPTLNCIIFSCKHLLMLTETDLKSHLYIRKAIGIYGNCFELPELLHFPNRKTSALNGAFNICSVDDQLHLHWKEYDVFGAQLIGTIQLHVKGQNSSICQFFSGHCLDFFLL